MRLSVLFTILLLSQFLTAQRFSESAQSEVLADVFGSTVAFGDVDGDNDLDVLITGQNEFLQGITKLYLNDGNGNYTELADTPFQDLWASAAAFADIDNDGDSDLLFSGRRDNLDPSSVFTKLYINIGDGEFIEDARIPFADILSTFDLADVDGDGDLDILLSGRSTTGFSATKLYLNDGTGAYEELRITPFPNFGGSSTAFADVDGDGDLDVIMSGAITILDLVTKLYINDGMGNYTEANENPFTGLTLSSVAFSDIDGDNDPDVLISGYGAPGIGITNLYVNDGMGNFSKIPAPFSQMYEGDIAFSDVDGDNDEDVVLSGIFSQGGMATELYINDGSGTFRRVSFSTFLNVRSSDISFADVDGDNDDDVIISGQDETFGPATKLYINERIKNPINGTEEGCQLSLTPYPNPGPSGTLNVDYNSTKQGGSLLLSIYDSKGALISQQQQQTSAVIGLQTLEIGTKTLPPGNYIVELTHGPCKGVAKFVVF